METVTTNQQDASLDKITTAKIDPAALMRVKNLTLRAKMVVEGFYHGLHRSPFNGQSIEFREYRPYTNGDDLRNLDWKLYARSDRYYIKKFEDETNRQCTLIHDQSRSMAYGSLDYTKAEYSSTVLATLAYHLDRQRDSVGLLTFDDHIKQCHPPSRTHGQLRRLMSSLSIAPSGKDTDIQSPLDEVAALAKRRGLVVLASDFLTPIENLRSSLSLLRARGHQVLLVRILDPAEVELSIDRPSMIFDMETESQIYIDPNVAREEYRNAFGKHRLELETTCQKLGVHFFEMLTSDPIDLALHEIISLKQHRATPATETTFGRSDNASDIEDAISWEGKT